MTWGGKAKRISSSSLTVSPPDRFREKPMNTLRFSALLAAFWLCPKFTDKFVGRSRLSYLCTPRDINLILNCVDNLRIPDCISCASASTT